MSGDVTDGPPTDLDRADGSLRAYAARWHTARLRLIAEVTGRTVRAVERRAALHARRSPELSEGGGRTP